MKIKVISQYYPKLTELEDKFAYLFLKSSSNFEGTQEGFFFPEDIKALKYLNIQDYLKYTHHKLPKFSNFPSCTELGKFLRGDHFELIPKLPQKRVSVKVPTLPKKVFQLAHKEGLKVYLVGGGVRDILLNDNNQQHKIKEEWDFVITSNFDHFLITLQRYFKGTLQLHPAYHTASLILKDGERLDFSKPRYEFYRPPGKAFEVLRAPLYLDLLRRDFTINALALTFLGEEYWLIDLWGGEEDLRNRVLRLVRPYAFLEDPLRILRAGRYLAILGFDLGERENRLILEAVKEIGKLEPYYLDQRFGREFTMFLSVNSDKIEELLKRFPLLSLLHNELAFFDYQIIDKAKNLYEESALKNRLSWENFLLLLILTYLPPVEVLIMWDKMNLRLAGVNFKRLLTYVNFDPSNFLNNAPDNLLPHLYLLYLCKNPISLDEAKRLLHIFQQDLIKAEDLKNLGVPIGPKYREIIRDIKIKSLEGKIKNKEEALRYLQSISKS